MGILATIYNGPAGMDALSVIPRSAKGVCVVNAAGPFEPDAEYPAVRIVATAGPRGCARAVPVEASDAGKWLMKGFSFIASSDSRFQECVETVTGAPFYGAVALHDRHER